MEALNDLPKYYRNLKNVATHFDWNKIALNKLHYDGVFTSLIGYGIAAITVLVIMNTRRSNARIIMAILSLLLLLALMVSTNNTNVVLLLMGSSVGVLCTYAQIESYKMIVGHLIQKKCD